jgi:hypothetical protein
VRRVGAAPRRSQARERAAAPGGRARARARERAYCDRACGLPRPPCPLALPALFCAQLAPEHGGDAAHACELLYLCVSRRPPPHRANTRVRCP